LKNVFFYYGTYYVKSIDNSEYISVNPLVGATVNPLQDVCEVINDNKILQKKAIQFNESFFL